MQTLRIALPACVVVAVATLFPVAHAARSYDNCTGYVDVAPAVLTTQGTWCLRKDIGTNLASGTAITIAAHNVTLDCNDFKVGNLAAGELNTARGIAAARDNTTVRNCNVRGFRRGIDITGYAALVEDNRLDGILNTGIGFEGEGGSIRRNRVFDTLSPVGGGDAIGIHVVGDAAVIDNDIANVVAVGSGANPVTEVHAIFISGQTHGLVERNRISGVSYTTLPGWSIVRFAALYVVGSTHTRVVANHMPTYAVTCDSASPRARDNTVANVFGCTNDGNSP